MAQDVIAFPVQPDEQADDLLLSMVLERQAELDSLETTIAALLYKGRALFIGGMCLPWGLLSKGQQQGYRMEAKRLIQERNA